MKNVDNLTGIDSLLKLEIFNPKNKIERSQLHELSNLEEFYLDPMLELKTLIKPMEQVKRLMVTDRNKGQFENQDLLINKMFPNAELVKFKSFSSFFNR